MLRFMCALVGLCLLPTFVAAQEATRGRIADLRVLDKLNGIVTDVSLRNGETASLGLMQVQMKECRFPAANPNGDAFAELRVSFRDNDEPVFEGWLIASAPALNAMEHPRYDVWVLRCRTS